MTKTLITTLLLALLLTACTPASSSHSYEETLLQGCRNQLDTVTSTDEKIENIVSSDNKVQFSLNNNLQEIPIPKSPSFELPLEQNAHYSLTPEQEEIISSAKKHILHFVKTSSIFTDKDKDSILIELESIPIVQGDFPSLPSEVYLYNGTLLIQHNDTFTQEDVEMELMRFLRIIATGSELNVPYQSSFFEKEMAYTILYSKFNKDGIDEAGANEYHHSLLDFLGIFQEEALYGYFYGYEKTNIPEDELILFISLFEQLPNKDYQKIVDNSVLPKWCVDFLLHPAEHSAN